MVNSNGIAVDPRGRDWSLGGEVNTPPSGTPDGQGDLLQTFLAMHPDAQVNYRSNLHVHVRVPGLREDLPSLKRLALFGFTNLDKIFPVIEPIPKPRPEDYSNDDMFRGARRRYRRRLVSHHTVVTYARMRVQQEVDDLAEFFSAEVPISFARNPLGDPQWHLAPRHAVNLRHLRDTETVEFRHFPGTVEPREVQAAVEWCRDYLRLALFGEPKEGLNKLLFAVKIMGDLPIEFPPYCHWMEERYRATCHDGSLPRHVISKNIEKILDGRFDAERVG